jgi:cobalt-zinc-cadmium efflux system outer membrane protein
MRRLNVPVIPGLCLVAVMVTTYALPGNAISFSQARERILMHNSGINALECDIKAAQQGVSQSRVMQNPTGSVALEKFGLNEIEAILGQTLELGGKRRFRAEAAEKELEISRNGLKLGSLELDVEIIRRFIPIAVGTRTLLLLDSIRLTAESTKEQIRKKVDAGAARKTDLIRAEITADQLAIERNEKMRELMQARNRFAALGGNNDSVLIHVSGALDLEAEVPSLDDLLGAIRTHPRFTALEIKRALIETQKKQLKAESVPDVNFSAGYINKLPESVHAPLVGIALDIPVFNRNIAAQRQLSFQHEGSSKRLENDLRILTADVQDSYGRVIGLKTKMTALRNGMIPKAEAVCAMLQEYYDAGSANFFDLSTAQSELLRMHLEMLAMETEWAHACADVMLSTGVLIQIVK